jgi:hypothetical protein
MKSATLPSFWEKYNSLDSRVKEQARKAYRLWLEIPFIDLCTSSASTRKKISGLRESRAAIEQWGFYKEIP